jgi:arylsulfatase
MKRRNFLAGTMAGAAAVATSAESVAAPETQGRKPNILWICTDQQRWDTIHALGNEHVHTPNIDRLVAEGVSFTHAYCQSPICTPSRASFLTGMYPGTLHACMNGNDSWDNAAPLITKTLADIGYDCGLSGKFHLSAADGRIEPRVDDGYRVFQWSHHPGDDWPEGHDYKDWLVSKGIDYNTTHKKYGYIPAEHHQTTWCAEVAIDFIRERRTAPWLFSLNCFDPHPALDPPQEYVDRYDVESAPGPYYQDSDLAAQKKLSGIRFQSEAKHPDEFDAKKRQVLYWAQIDLIDEQVGRILDVLEETGQRDNTVIIFTSDHGNSVGDHGLINKGCRFYEGLTRVPLIFSWPGYFKQNLQSDALVELTDIVPMLLELAGLPIPDDMHGKSLLPILTGVANAGEHREFVRSTYYRALDDKLQSYATMIRNRRYKLVHFHGHGLGELFDLENDPHEFTNLFDSPDHKNIRLSMTDQSFDAMAFAIDVGSKRVGRY